MEYAEETGRDLLCEVFQDHRSYLQEEHRPDETSTLRIGFSRFPADSMEAVASTRRPEYT